MCVRKRCAWYLRTYLQQNKQRTLYPSYTACANFLHFHFSFKHNENINAFNLTQEMKRYAMLMAQAANARNAEIASFLNVVR